MAERSAEKILERRRVQNREAQRRFRGEQIRPSAAHCISTCNMRPMCEGMLTARRSISQKRKPYRRRWICFNSMAMHTEI